MKVTVKGTTNSLRATMAKGGQAQGTLSSSIETNVTTNTQGEMQVKASGNTQARGEIAGASSMSGIYKSGHSYVSVCSMVTLLASAWVGDDSPYSQVVTIDKATKNSKIDLQPSVEQLAIFHDKDLAFVTENDDGVITVYAIGDRPTNDYTIQVTITEVAV